MIQLLPHACDQLPSSMVQRQAPTPAPQPAWVHFNASLAAELNLPVDPFAEDLALLSGGQSKAGCDPVALAYAGHQFGHFVPQLGDGRAVWLGDAMDATGNRYDIQLKGSGRTPFSRSGDGLSPLGPVIREYLVSHAMHHLGIPTTRSLAAIQTGQPVYRDIPLPGGVLTRVARSHIRVGSFQFLAAHHTTSDCQKLIAYCIDRLYPELADASNPALALLDAVVQRQASRLSQWMGVGFIHGVMNTDNMAISGETIDYGPCAFMEEFDPHCVFSAIDSTGRYAFSNQPAIAHWNLIQLAIAIAPPDRLSEYTAIVDSFWPQFQTNWYTHMAAKIGLRSYEPNDAPLIDQFLTRLVQSKRDYTNTFRDLSHWLRHQNSDGSSKSVHPELDPWMASWTDRLNQTNQTWATIADEMDLINPAVIPRNHAIEAIISAAMTGDYQPLNDWFDRLTHPFTRQPFDDRFTTPATLDERVTQTFCGT